MHRLPPYLFKKINSEKNRMRRENIDIIDLGMGNPNDPTPQLIVDKLKQASEIKRNQRYSVSVGIDNLRREAAKFYARHFEVPLDQDSEIIATIGSKEAFSHLCLAVLGPGDTVMVPSPFFPIHIYGPVIAGAQVVSIPMGSSDADLLEHIDMMCTQLFPKPKVLILNFPHNPTAKTVEKEFFAEIVKLAHKHRFYVIHDFAYGLTTFDSYRAPSFLSIPGAKEIGVEIFTTSKAFNMAEWRLGFAVGNSTMLSLLGEIKGYYDYGIFQAIQIAGIIALRECDAEMKKQADIYALRRDVLHAGLCNLGFPVKKPLAGMFLWAKLPDQFQTMGSLEFSMRCLKDAHVVVTPGIGFGDGGEGYVRIALVENEDRLKQALRQIKQVFFKE